MIPAGHSDTWTDAEMDAFDFAYERLKEQDQDTLWELVMDQDNDLGDGSTWVPPMTSITGINGMTDAEWELYDQAIDASKCTCNGPGSKHQKWPTHTSVCPAYKQGQKADYSYKPLGYAGYEGQFGGESSFGGSFPGTGTVSKHCTHNADPVLLLDGITVYASSRYGASKAERDVDWGIYLANSWMYDADVTTTIGVEIPWTTESKHTYPMVCLDWPDRGTPSTSITEMVSLCNWVLKAASEGLAIDFGCVGGHGRTGTMLACLLIVQGLIPYYAVDRLWGEDQKEGGYCTNAVEARKQLDYLTQLYEAVHGKLVMDTETQKMYDEWVDKYFKVYTPVAPPAKVVKALPAKAGKAVAGMFGSSHMGKGV
jgi:hypothetical protein